MKKCSRCSKPATLHITELRDGTAQVLHLCESCAQQYISSPAVSEGSAEEDESGAAADEALEELDQLVCPNCGITFREFRSQGRLGCPQDYIAFERELMPLLESIHGETQHVGKCPRRAPHASQRQYQLIKLRSELKNAIDSEEYESAARIRDRIQSLEKELAAEEAGDGESAAGAGNPSA